MRLVVIADTHLRNGRWLPDEVDRALDGADAALHAGDIIESYVLERLRARLPVHAVVGNNDTALGGELPVTLEVDLGGVRFALVHDSGPAKGRQRRLKRLFPAAGVVVFGHSHIPWNEVTSTGQVLFNPGSPTQRRRQPRPTYGEIEVRDGCVQSCAIVELGGQAEA